MPDNDEICRALEETLRLLEVQAAKYGGLVPTHISIGIRETKQKLAELNCSAPPPAQKHREWIVDSWHRGDFITISEAIDAAKDGDIIRVRPGIYEESLQITKVLEIIGDGDRNEIEVHAEGAHTIVFAARHGHIRGLTLRQNGGKGNWFGVDITDGRLTLEDCDISSASSACVAIHNGAKPIVRNNRIHDGEAGGIFVYDNGTGLIEGNDIFANVLAGIEIIMGGNPTVRTNRIHDGKDAGIYVHNNGTGIIEGNDIFTNAYAGIAIKTSGNPTVRTNRIHDGKAGGIYVYDHGAGIIEGNHIFANAYAGISVKTGSKPTVRNNRIQNNTFLAIRIYEGGRGTFIGNNLRGNKRGAWDVAKDCLPHITRRDNQE